MDLPQQIKKLYLNEKLSMTEVGYKLGISKWKVISLMRKHNIPRRKPAETQKIQYLKKPPSFLKKKTMTPKEKSIYQASIMLYWAEGVKGTHTVDFPNSDKRMVKLFLLTLRKIYQVKEEKLRVLLYCYSNQDINKLLNYWSKYLDIPKAQFTKPYVRKDFNKNNTHKMPHGLVHVRYNDKKLIMEIKREIDIMSSTLTI